MLSELANAAFAEGGIGGGRGRAGEGAGGATMSDPPPRAPGKGWRLGKSKRWATTRGSSTMQPFLEARVYARTLKFTCVKE